MNRTPEHIADELLVMRCQDRDAAAFAELVGRWQPRLARHAAALAGDPRAASDIMQEAWMAIVRGLGGLDDPARFPAWAYRIVTRKCADWIRKRQRRRRLVDGLSRERLAAGPVDAGPPESDEEGAPPDDDTARLRRAIRRLPADRRALLRLYYFEGMNTAAIAMVLDIPAGTVKSRLFHIRRKLKITMERRSS